MNQYEDQNEDLGPITVDHPENQRVMREEYLNALRRLVNSTLPGGINGAEAELVVKRYRKMGLKDASYNDVNLVVPHNPDLDKPREQLEAEYALGLYNTRNDPIARRQHVTKYMNLGVGNVRDMSFGY